MFGEPTMTMPAQPKAETQTEKAETGYELMEKLEGMIDEAKYNADRVIVQVEELTEAYKDRFPGLKKLNLGTIANPYVWAKKHMDADQEWDDQYLTALETETLPDMEQKEAGPVEDPEIVALYSRIMTLGSNLKAQSGNYIPMKASLANVRASDEMMRGSVSVSMERIDGNPEVQEYKEAALKTLAQDVEARIKERWEAMAQGTRVGLEAMRVVQDSVEKELTVLAERLG